jgi:hypothetical protein
MPPQGPYGVSDRPCMRMGRACTCDARVRASGTHVTRVLLPRVAPPQGFPPPGPYGGFGMGPPPGMPPPPGYGMGPPPGMPPPPGYGMGPPMGMPPPPYGGPR